MAHRKVSASFSFDPLKLKLLMKLSAKTGVPQTVYMRDALDLVLKREGILAEDAGHEEETA